MMEGDFVHHEEIGRWGWLVLAKERAQEAGPPLRGNRKRLGEGGLQDGLWRREAL